MDEKGKERTQGKQAGGSPDGDIQEEDRQIGEVMFSPHLPKCHSLFIS